MRNNVWNGLLSIIIIILMWVASHQWTGPRVREVAQPVPAHIEDTQGFQTVHHLRAQTAEAVTGHVQLLQSAKTYPVGVWQGGETEHKSDGHSLFLSGEPGNKVQLEGRVGTHLEGCQTGRWAGSWQQTLSGRVSDGEVQMANWSAGSERDSPAVTWERRRVVSQHGTNVTQNWGSYIFSFTDWFNFSHAATSGPLHCLNHRPLMFVLLLGIWEIHPNSSDDLWMMCDVQIIVFYYGMFSMCTTRTKFSISIENVWKDLKFLFSRVVLDSITQCQACQSEAPHPLNFICLLRFCWTFANQHPPSPAAGENSFSSSQHKPQTHQMKNSSRETIAEEDTGYQLKYSKTLIRCCRSSHHDEQNRQPCHSV